MVGQVGAEQDPEDWWNAFVGAARELIAGAQAELRRDDGVLAARAERLSEKALAFGPAVHVGGVEEIDAGVERGVHHIGRSLLVDRHAEVVAADSDDGDVQ